MTATTTTTTDPSYLSLTSTRPMAPPLHSTNNNDLVDHRTFLFSDIPRQAPVVSTHEWGEWFLYEDHACLQTKPPPTFLQLTPDENDKESGNSCARCHTK